MSRHSQDVFSFPRMCDRNGGRRLRQWLIEQIDSAMYPGLIWENDQKSMFRIPWKHAGKQDYNQEVDASIFKVETRPRPPRSRGSGLMPPSPACTGLRFL